MACQPPTKCRLVSKRIRQALLALVAGAAIPVSASEKWIEIRSPHFVVESNASEAKARNVARAFEEVRSVFQAAFHGIRVDTGERTLVIACRDDDSLKSFLLDYAATKNRAQLAGWFQPTLDTNYAVINASSYEATENAYHVIFHEFTHGIVRMNFGPIPAWLNEGFAEYYGNTVVKPDETDIGQVTDSQLYLLQTAPMIPLLDLLKVDIHSPLYNERNRSSMFYAESWVMVHYLRSDREALQNHLLQKYFIALGKGEDSVAAATEAFGDLGAFEQKLKAYLRRQGFNFMRMKPIAQIGDKSLAARPLPEAELLAIKADFFARSGHLKEAGPLAAEALRLSPDLGAAHEAAGYADYREGDQAKAASEFLKAAQLDTKDFRPPFYLAELGNGTQAAGRLEAALAINPDFAPAQSKLAFAYLNNPATRDKAPGPAIRAAEIDPASLNYLANLGEIYLALGRTQDARAVSERLTRTARTPEEKAMASSFASRAAGSGN